MINKNTIVEQANTSVVVMEMKINTNKEMDEKSILMRL